MCLLNLEYRELPSQKELRLRYVKALLAPYERDYVLSNVPGIGATVFPAHVADTRSILQLPTQLSHEVDLGSDYIHCFNMTLLRGAFSQYSKVVKRWRILQCVHEIGSLRILESIRSILLHQANDIPIAGDLIIQKIQLIHHYLDEQNAKDRLLVARARYIKFCYYENYNAAVNSVRRQKEQDLVTRKRIAKHKTTATYLAGNGQTETERDNNQVDRRRAEQVVKDDIANKIERAYGGSPEDIRANITKYVREGYRLHCILQGQFCLNPGVLLIFPSTEDKEPSLDVAKLNAGLSESELKSLRNPICIGE